MFPMETRYYSASDCDDRSILFAHLIEQLTDLEYIIVRYPGYLTPTIYRLFIFQMKNPKDQVLTVL